MIVTVTYIKLRSAFDIVPLIRLGKGIKKQLKQEKCRGYKQYGFWRDIYTMTLWDNEEDMKIFARSGAHKESMQHTAKLGERVKTLTFETDHFPKWRTARKLLHSTGKVINFPPPVKAEKNKHLKGSYVSRS